jgi:hypothetical protein
MDRVKVTLVSFLPALWLMASGPCLVDPCGNCATVSTCGSAFAFEKGKHCPSSGTSCIDVSALPSGARMGSHSVKGNLFCVQPTTGSVVDRRFLANFSFDREGALALATRWQFDCRAAAEPRAPSSVS